MFLRVVAYSLAVSLSIANAPDLLFAQSNGVPPVSFANGPSYSSGGVSDYSAKSADLNGDGKPDLVVSNFCQSSSSCTSGTVGILLGNGDGTFQPAVTYDSGGYAPISIAIADVNGDGNLDVVVVNECAGYSNGCSGTGLIGVLLGNGDGSFRPVVTYSSGGYDALSVAVGDVNRDGKLDLVVANECTEATCSSGQGSLGVLLGKGDGTFESAVTYASGGYGSQSVALADFNNDQVLDIVVANQCMTTTSCEQGGSVAVLLGNGNGTFRTAVTYSSGGLYASSVAVADVNGDGKSDLLIANPCSTASCNAGGSLGVLLGNGNGTFKGAVSYATGGISTESVAVADLNGDGRPDLAVASLGSTSTTAKGAVQVLLGNGDGTFQTPIHFDPGFATPSLTIADVNADGKPDIVVVGGSNGEIEAMLNSSGTGVVSAKVLVFGDVLVNQPSSEQRVSLTNVGSSLISVSSISVSGDFAVPVNHCLSGIKPGTHCDVYVTFTPLSLGAQNGTLTFVDSASNSPQTVALTGVGATTVSTTTTVTRSAYQFFAGSPVTFTATVKSLGGGIIPDGEQILFQSVQQGSIGYGTLQSGVARITTSELKFTGPSRHPGGQGQDILAQYAGDASFYGSQGNTDVLIERYPVSISVGPSPNPSVYCEPISFRASVTSSAPYIPTGVIEMYGDFFFPGSVTLQNGVATRTSAVCALSQGGPEYITYEGDAYNDWGYGSSIDQTIKPTPTTTTITSSKNPSLQGNTVRFTAVLRAPWAHPIYGSVTFTTGGITLGTVALVGSTASITTSSLPIGQNTIVVTYTPANDKFVSSSASLVQVVE